MTLGARWGHKIPGHLLHAGIGQFSYLAGAFAGDGMVDHHHRVLGQPQGPGPQLGGLGKRPGDDRDRGLTPLLGFYSVVETPRYARTSIGHGMDDGVAPGGQVV